MIRTALDNISGDCFTLNDNVIKQGLIESRQSPRKRIILPVHRKQDARVQRMLNFLQPGTYIRPHKHPLEEASESIVVLQGSIRFFVFDSKGSVQNTFVLLAHSLTNLIDIEPNVWHNFIALREDTILFEVKNGPYDARTDKIFADWAPEEFSQNCEKYMDELKMFS